MDRAYSVLQIKSIDDEARVIEGIASSPTTDRMGDIVEPKGAEYSLPLPFLWQHNAKEPIGHVTKAKVTKDAINVRVEVVKSDEPGKLKDRLDEAWQSIKLGLVRGLSIGFKPIESEDIEDTGRSFFPPQRYTKWEWLELSAVTIPANIDATITTVKQFDTPNNATPLPRTSGRPVKAMTPPPKAKGTMANVIEQIRQFEATRQAKAARMDELMKGAADKGETLDAEQEQEFDLLESEVASIDKHLARLHTQEQMNKSTAVPVNGASSQGAGAARTPVAPIRVKTRAAPGIGYARYAMVLLRNNGDRRAAAEDARRSWPDQAAEIEVELLQKAAVAPGTTTDATWAGPLVQPTTLANEFLEFLRPKTIIGRIPGLTQVDFNSRVTSQTGTGTYNWVGEGKPKPLTALAFAAVILPYTKVAGIIVLTDETVRLSTPSAEQKVRNDMTAGIASFMDNQFLDPAVTLIAGTRPASITESIAGTAASGTTEAFARADLRLLLNGFTDGMDDDGIVIIMKPGFAFTLGTMVNALGQPAFAGLTRQGGNLLGTPVITSNATALATQIVAIHAPSILIADDGSVTIDMSREASLEMESAPTNPLTSTTVLTSLWQHNMVGLRAERNATWLRARVGSVRRIHTVAYA